MREDLNTIKSLNQIVTKKDFGPRASSLLRHLLLDLILLTFSWQLLNQSSLISILGLTIVVPTLMFRCFGLLHDCVHQATHENKILNAVIGEIMGPLCLLPFYQWQAIHLQHHIWAGNVDKDPVMRLMRDYPRLPEGKKRFLRFSWRSWIPLMALSQHLVFWAAAIQQTKIETKWRGKARCLLSYFWPAAVYLLAVSIFGLKLALLLPGVILYLAMVEVINFPHHLQLPQIHGEKTLPFALQFKIARSCRYPKLFARHVLNNFNHHTEHHIFPRLPWYYLEEVRPQVKKILEKNYNESEKSAWILKSRSIELDKILFNDSAIDQIKSTA